ncbi:type II toxin-antitoxin system HipA family toxin [Desulfurispira natronophila]|uniref:Serine/threonine-protein kinase HipA n=1 Tax=Desulfurispira natronophila TaxID=682562 RepID=A0A7W8DGK1_9BACT|nr:type II toxin-antitoxin system HipA family toxin [Desulfurispira natronophila]MBB5021348.1 serine/threonine-protein kinase HipA [Desulfurispira natronophila]
MKVLPVTMLNVLFHQGFCPPIRVGRLALSQRRIAFEYDTEFIGHSLELSPFKLPLQAGVAFSDPKVFEGLFGLFNDSLPDGWGRLLLDRQLRKHAIDVRRLTPLDLLALVGANGMGALSYEPQQPVISTAPGEISLDTLCRESWELLQGNDSKCLEDLLLLSGSSAGARPKVMVDIVNGDIVKAGSGTADAESWVVKFRATSDPADIGVIEYAYSLMAKDAGIEIPATKLFRTERGMYFGVKRFDRAAGRRIHVHSLAGLLHADHRTPCLDYDDVLKATTLVTRSFQETQKAFALACFNVLCHNRDDHSKNFSCLLDDTCQWKFAPAYDLTFSYGPGGEHSTMVMGEGRNPGRKHLLELGKAHGIKSAAAILERVRSTVLRFNEFADLAGVSEQSTALIEDSIQRQCAL